MALQPVPMWTKAVGRQMVQSCTPLERELKASDVGIDVEKVKATSEVGGRVSVVTPTTASRARFHPQLWRCFLNQTYPDKELVVVETHHGEPSAFFQELAGKDPRLKYISIYRPKTHDLPVGTKRNLTCLMASGQYIVNFDDDDLYADRYVERMVSEMRKRSLVALTLSGWYNFFESRGIAGYSEPNAWEVEDENEMDEILFGYGFSYAHLRSVAQSHPYPNLCFAEDAPFMLKLREIYGQCVGLLEDVEGLCLHIVHSSSSTPDPEVSYVLSEEELDELEVSDSSAFQEFLQRPWFSWFNWLWYSCC